MRIAGRYILTTNEYKVLVKCKKIIRKEKCDIMRNGRKLYEGYEYRVIVDIYKRKEDYTISRNTEFPLYLNYNRHPYDWKFLTKEEFQVELL